MVVTTPGSSISPSVGQTGAGNSSAVRTEGLVSDVSLPVARDHTLLSPALSHLAPGGNHRYACAHVSALQAAAALLAARARPAPRARRQKNAWVLLAEVAPEFVEWSMLFAAGASKRAAAEAGSSRAVTEREADDLIRDADRFLAVVEQALGLIPHVRFEGQKLGKSGVA